MSPELALLDELWDRVKLHIQKKDRLSVAEMIIGVFDEYLDIADIEIYKNDFDPVMKAAIVSYMGYQDADDDEDPDDQEDSFDYDRD
jgi:hypothetical protein